MRCAVPTQTSVQEGTMKLLFFDDFKLGVLKGDAVIDVSETVRNIPHAGPHDLISGLIARFADYKERVQEAVDRGRGVPIGQVRVRPPLPKPSNIVAMAVNYMEDGTRAEPAPIGPYLGTADEVSDPHKLQVRLWVNGTLKQNFNTSDMAHRIPRCVEWVSSIHTLEPGDVLATGTNHRGLSAFQEGDLIELETEGLGRLRLHVRDDVKRTWARETRLERQQKGLEGTTPQLTGKHTPTRS